MIVTKTQVSKICKAFVNGSSANIKVSKTQLSKILQSGGILADSIHAFIAQAIFITRVKAWKRGIKKVKH